MPLGGGNLGNTGAGSFDPFGYQGYSTEYAGDSLEDFYDYLLTPRHQMERSSMGAITHYGPSRYASIRPEDAEMAEFVWNQILNQQEMPFRQEALESESARRRAADEILMPQGYGGGEITIAGQGYGEPADTRFGRMRLPTSMAEGAQGSANIGTRGGKPPQVNYNDPMVRAQLAAGGVPPDQERIQEAQGRGYASRSGRGLTPYQEEMSEERRSKLIMDIGEAEADFLGNITREKGFEGYASAEQFMADVETGKVKLPDWAASYYNKWKAGAAAYYQKYGELPPSIADIRATGQNLGVEGPGRDYILDERFFPGAPPPGYHPTIPAPRRTPGPE